MSTLPMLKKATLTERLAVPCDKAMKAELLRLKQEKGINVPEWIRQLISENLKKIA